MTRLEVMKKIIENEKKRTFDVHIDPVNYDNVIKVDENFHYIKTFKQRITYFFQRLFIVNPYTWYINKIRFKTKVIGKENLKGVKKAILTCNHVDMFDCLVVKGSLKPRKIYVTAAPFNNQKGFLGQMMRAGGMMPMSEDYNGMRNFNKAIGYFLNKNKYIMFYPEQAMWWHYEKPRPYKNGAFHFAVKHNVPIIPLFLTFTNRDKTDGEGIPLKKITLNILPPIYPKNTLSNNENVDYLRNKNFEMCKTKYEDFYQTPLSYDE